MRRKALLIANLDAVGSQNDINNWKKFLLSGRGGAWRENEIMVLTNPSKNSLNTVLCCIKNSGYDFIIVVYAGHGGWKRSTILEINPDCETIGERDLKGLSSREILILDCCRATSTETYILDELQLKLFSDSIRSDIRIRYDARILQAIEQQVTLYACGIGECAYCSNNGGYYTKNLLTQSAIIPPHNEFKTINQAHTAAAIATTLEVWEKEKKNQHPNISVARCLSSQQLIISIDTSKYGIAE